jgi:hypothetical protein
MSKGVESDPPSTPVLIELKNIVGMNVGIDS